MPFFLNDYALDIAKKVSSKIDVVDKDAINQSIEAILMTEPNERVFENFGSFLSQIIFENLDSRTAENLLDEIIRLILRYENRISILSNLCSMVISQNTHSLTLTIVYVISQDNSPGEFNKKIVF